MQIAPEAHTDAQTHERKNARTLARTRHVWTVGGEAAPQEAQSREGSSSPEQVAGGRHDRA